MASRPYGVHSPPGSQSCYLLVTTYTRHHWQNWQLSWPCDNLVFISHASKSTVSFSVTSCTYEITQDMIQEFIISILRHIPLQLFSDFTKVSRSRIIRSIRLLAAHATVVSRHLYITSWAHCARVCAVFYKFYFYPLPADLQWTQLCDFQDRNRKPVLAFLKTENPVLPMESGFGNPSQMPVSLSI